MSSWGFWGSAPKSLSVNLSSGDTIAEKRPAQRPPEHANQGGNPNDLVLEKGERTLSRGLERTTWTEAFQNSSTPLAVIKAALLNKRVSNLRMESSVPIRNLYAVQVLQPIPNTSAC